MASSVIDFSKLNGEERARTMAEIATACEEWGFFQLENHGIWEELREKVKKVAAECFKVEREEGFKNFHFLPRAAPLLPSTLPQPPTNNEVDHEATANHVQHSSPAAADPHNLEWAMSMLSFCLPLAVEIALQSSQTQFQLPPTFHFVCLAITFSFTFLFLGKFTSSIATKMAQVLQWFGVFFAVTAFYLAITIPLPLWLKCVSWTLYGISIAAVMVCMICTRI